MIALLLGPHHTVAASTFNKHSAELAEGKTKWLVVRRKVIVESEPRLVNAGLSIAIAGMPSLTNDVVEFRTGGAASEYRLEFLQGDTRTRVREVQKKHGI
jgi:hypothetical protein